MFGFNKRHREHGGHHGFHAMRGRHRGGFGDAFGEGFGEGMGGRGGRRGGGRRRVFESTELRLVLLALIGEQPRHGYDLIKAIEERSGGSYAPSPGVVYPTLTMLQDMGLIAEQAAEGSKRLFAITEAGKLEIGEQAEQVEALFARIEALGEEQGGGHDRAPVRRAMVNLAMVLRDRMGRSGNTDLAHEVAAILDEATRKIERL
ncbi:MULTISPECIES: PadR family transcriptional regulator [unclassified Sphingomonas]|uniref:PadR family transcriptional regulator n=1 Tax=unclassified Sphingomonas TaxID=196159 RepID=UPI0006F4ED74|nr:MULTISPECIES: PadR family transcriptional regulator [unclassified Sphingomonas]KQX25961.1 PadR family transcriptional regulator [Sphingomonas sp. Root1294]KQY69026.1 PadR family transcriptional regulator [Sphingomonas sp. Root50]KRB89282.1 PadR family transcriptional regulator [Sphingomonas sp. Root720]